MAVASELRKVLLDLKTMHNVEACAVVSKNGIPIAWEIPNDVHLETFSTLSATILGASDVVCSGLSKEPPERILIESKSANLVVIGVSPKALLVAMSSSADSSTLIASINEAASRIKEVLQYEK